MNVYSIAYVVVTYLAALLKNEAFFSEAFPILERHLMGFWCNIVSLAERKREEGAWASCTV
jgi:hypothetical protein